MRQQSPQKKPLSIKPLLRQYARPMWRQLALLIFLTLLANVATTLEPVVLSGVVEVVMESRQDKAVAMGPAESPTPPPALNFFDLNTIGKKVKNAVPRLLRQDAGNTWSALIAMAAVYLLLVFLSSLIGYAALVLTRWIRTKAALLIRRDVLKHLLTLNLGFFHRQKSGELISRVIQDAQNTGQGLGPLVSSFIHHTVLIVIYSLYLFSTSVGMTFCALGMILLQFGLTEIIKRPIRSTTKNYLSKTAGLTTTLQETFGGIRVIKSFGAEGYELDKLDNDLERTRAADFQQGLVENIEGHARGFLDAVALCGIFLIAAFQLMRDTLSIQGFLLFVYVGRLLITPINKFAVNVVWIQALMASYERLHELFAERPRVADGARDTEDFGEAVVLRQVSFSYGNEFVLRDVSLTLKKGEILALVGPSGAGKSTLTDLILRFYDPQEGEITIDGINLRSLRFASYRRLFGVVPQDNLLFNDTVANNIRYGRREISEADIVEAARIANATEFINELAQGYDTFVGDRGVRLSGGQRQRIAIARAIVARPRILIFDEATSSLDTQSERLVQEAVDRVLANSTAIVIAHRLSTILHAHKIAVLNKGRIEAVGRHDELLKNCGLYRHLYDLQFAAPKNGRGLEEVTGATRS